MKGNRSIVLRRNVFHDFEVIKTVNFHIKEKELSTTEVEKLLAKDDLKVIIEYEER